jgi:hypothetical protein
MLLPKEECLIQIAAVHKDILQCEQHPHLQRYACLSQRERELISACLVPQPHLRLMACDLWKQHEYFKPEGLTAKTEEAVCARLWHVEAPIKADTMQQVGRLLNSVCLQDSLSLHYSST